MPPCPRCAGAEVKKDGRIGETQRYRCRSCCRTFIARTGTPFAGHRWPQEISVTAVRWYLRFRLSAADVRDRLAERGVDVSARTVLYWVQKFAPLLARAGRRAATRPGARWWCDETYVRVGGKWAYRYRAIEKAIERSHVPMKDRLRPMRGLQSVRTGQRAIEGVELARAVRRGHVTAPDTVFGDRAGPHARARATVTTCTWLADGLRVAA